MLAVAWVLGWALPVVPAAAETVPRSREQIAPSLAPVVRAAVPAVVIAG